MSKNAKKLGYGFCGDPTSLQKSTRFYFYCFVSLIFIIIPKQQKHANNKNQKNIFIINLDLQSSDSLFILLS